jgi:hypothetical protein
VNLSALVALISLNLTSTLVTDYEFVAGTLPITGATVSTPIQVTCAAHGLPPGRTLHGVVTGVGGTFEANGVWVLSYVDPNTLSLSTLSAQGLPAPSVGVHTYTSGGLVSYAFPIPDGRALMGRRNVPMVMSDVSPRIVFVPTDGRRWGFEAYAGANPNILPAESPNVQGSLEQQSMTTQPQLATHFPTFEVYVTATAKLTGSPNPDPDALDFDAVEVLCDILYGVLFDSVGGRVNVLHEAWPSQGRSAGTASQRGQQKLLVIELQQPVTKPPLGFVPSGVSLVETVYPINPLVPNDETIITIDS